MDLEFRDPFTVRHRRTIAIVSPIAAVVLSVLFYNVTAPRSVQTAAASGTKLRESDLLQVGALPVT